MLYRAPPPTDIARIDEIQKVIDSVGWTSIVEAARAVKEFYAEDWQVFCLHCRFVQGESRISDETSLQKVSRRVGLSPNTVSRKRRKILLAHSPGRFERVSAHPEMVTIPASQPPE